MRDFAALNRGAGQIERLMVIPGSITVLVVGTILALMTNAPMLGLLQGASENWLLVSNILLIINLLAVPLIYVPRDKKIEPILHDALAAGEISSQLRATLDDPVVYVAHWYDMGSLVIIVALMVFRPF